MLPFASVRVSWAIYASSRAASAPRSSRGQDLALLAHAIHSRLVQPANLVKAPTAIGQHRLRWCSDDRADSTRRIGGIIMIGLRELAILAVVVLVLYGRSGVLKSRQFQTIWPWISPQRRVSQAGGIGSGCGRFPARGQPWPPERPRPARRARHFLAARQPPVLVLDDPGCDRRGLRDRRPNDDRQRGGPRARTLTEHHKSRPSSI